VSTANLATLVSTTYLTTQLNSTILGLGTAGYISSSQLLSTSAGLTILLNSAVTTATLNSTIDGLGTAGYLSSIGTQTVFNAITANINRLNTSYISVNNIFVPGSTFNLTFPDSNFTMAVSTNNQTYFGYWTSTTNLVYMGDIYANNFLSSTVLAIEQMPNFSNIIYTGSNTYQTFTVPAGVTLLNVELYGAGGATRGSGMQGGAGGFVSGSLNVTPGETLTLIVPAGGGYIGSIYSGGYGGGGNAAGGSCGGGNGGGGGGRAAILRGASGGTGGTELCTAGGGGGAGYNTIETSPYSTGGDGGGSTADGGGTYNGSGYGGGGATVSSGGAGGTGGTAGTAGSARQGGTGGGAGTGSAAGGGGGGGYYGGGGGAASGTPAVGGGGGGSSYTGGLTGTIVNTKGGGSAGGSGGSGGGFGGVIKIYYLASGATQGNFFEIKTPFQKMFVNRNMQLGIGMLSTANTTFGLNVGTSTLTNSIQSQNLILTDKTYGNAQYITVDNGYLQLNGGTITGGGGGGGGGGVSSVVGTAPISAANNQGNITLTFSDTYVKSLAVAGGITTNAATGAVTITGPSLTNLVSSANLVGLISSANLVGLISSANLVGIVSTANLVGLISTANLVGLVSTANLVGLVSTANLAGLVRTANLAGLVSTANLSGLLSTVNLTNLVSTANLAGLVSTANLINLVSTANLANLISTANLANLISTANLSGLVSSANLTGLVSTANLSGLISTANLAGLISTANLAGLVSTANLVGLVSSANLATLVSTANLVGLVSTTYLTTQLNSTVAGLGTAGYLSSTSNFKFSTGLIVVSSVNFFDGFPSYGLNYMTVSSGKLLLNGAFVSGGTGGSGVIQVIGGTNINVSPVAGTGIVTITMASTFLNTNDLNSNITSSIIGLGTAGYISSANLRGLVSTANLATLVSTANLAGLISTANLATLVSTANLSGLVSSANLTGLVSTSFFDQRIQSTVAGLGTASYISSAQLLSTTFGLTVYVSSFVSSYAKTGGGTTDITKISSIILSSLTVGYSNISTPGFFTMNNTLNTLYFGTYGSSGQIYMGDIQANLGNSNDTTPLLFLEQQAALVNITSTSNYSYTGTTTTYTVPAGVYYLDIQLLGAGGGNVSYAGNGGPGGFTQGLLPVTPGQVLTLFVGQANGGLPAGGAGALGGAGGGGRSYIQIIINGTPTEILTAGGGGGGAYGGDGVPGNGGAGGGGTPGTNFAGGNGGGPANGRGGTSAAGGIGGPGVSAVSGYPGTFQHGGAGNATNFPAGGGGDGYYGGGGGGESQGTPYGGGAGGGGSGFAYYTVLNIRGSQGGGAATNTNGSIVISAVNYVPKQGAILQMKNYLGNNLIVDPSLNVGINVSSVNKAYGLEVIGAAKANSLYMVDATTNISYNLAVSSGNIYFNGSSFSLTQNILSSMAGLSNVAVTSLTTNTGDFTLSGSNGAISMTLPTTLIRTNDLVSTIDGLGTAGYMSTSQLLSTTRAYANSFATLAISSVQVNAFNISSSYVMSSNLFVTGSTVSSFAMWIQNSTTSFGFTSPSTAQIYIGDLFGVNNLSNPITNVLAIEQLPFPKRLVYTGSNTYQTFVVPNNVSYIEIELTGAGGGTAGSGMTGGSGGFVSGRLIVTPGETLTLIVPSGGGLGTSSGGYGGGGTGASGSCSGGNSGGGGGRAAILRGATGGSGGTELCTAGGGGGGGYHTGSSGATGGNGGGSTGNNGGTSGGYSGYGGNGGTNSAAGTGGSGGGNNGYQTTGGVGRYAGSGSYCGGAGGGGYYGGGGGGATSGPPATGGGGGGASYTGGLSGTIVNIQGGGASGGTTQTSGTGLPGNISITYLDPGVTTGNLLTINNKQGNLFFNRKAQLGINIATASDSNNSVFIGGSTIMSTLTATSMIIKDQTTNLNNYLAVNNGYLQLNGGAITGGGGGVSSISGTSPISAMNSAGNYTLSFTDTYVKSLSVAGGLTSNATTGDITITGPDLTSYGTVTQLTSTISGLGNVAVTQITAGTNITLSGSGVGNVTINASGSGSIPDPLTLNSLNISSITGSGSPNLISINGAPFANKQGQVTIVKTDTSVTITDVNIRSTSVIMVTPLTEISYGLSSEFQNYWITLTPSTSWTINLSQTPTVDISFMYFIASY
jgi:hypothetical protein